MTLLTNPSVSTNFPEAPGQSSKIRAAQVPKTLRGIKLRLMGGLQRFTPLLSRPSVFWSNIEG
jgi:hypothetical protein